MFGETRRARRMLGGAALAPIPGMASEEVDGRSSPAKADRRGDVRVATSLRFQAAGAAPRASVGV